MRSLMLRTLLCLTSVVVWSSSLLAQPVASRVMLGSISSTGVKTGVTTGTGSPVAAMGHPQIVIVFESIGTTSGGTVVIEEASWSQQLNETTYAGTWSLVTSVDASEFTGTAQKAVHLSPTTHQFLRARITSNITGGGTILIRLSAN